jgi:hypothetical protein
MKKITISSSIRFRAEIVRALGGFEALGIGAEFPNLGTDFPEDGISIDTVRSLQSDHFAAIDSSDALYVINPDGYIGLSVTLEIGYALGQRVPIYFMERPNLQELEAVSGGYIGLDELYKLK